MSGEPASREGSVLRTSGMLVRLVVLALVAWFFTSRHTGDPLAILYISLWAVSAFSITLPGISTLSRALPFGALMGVTLASFSIGTPWASWTFWLGCPMVVGYVHSELTARRQARSPRETTSDSTESMVRPTA